ncbi:hypothetical protein TNCV_97581 [Trichonephila clavipes]|nr:hypothetical protein TNCV_97581 [Trichonephila clavipes]
MPYDLSSNPKECMDVCKCAAPSWQGGTLNSRRAASPLERLVKGVIRYQANKMVGAHPNPIGMQGHKCRSFELWCKEAEKKNTNINTLMRQKTFY